MIQAGNNTLHLRSTDLSILFVIRTNCQTSGQHLLFFYCYWGSSVWSST